MFLVAATLLNAVSAAPAFPERMPSLIEACLKDAIVGHQVTTTAESYKYICVGNAASSLWAFLDAAKLETWEQKPGGVGTWLSREFPLGGCFKQLKNEDGTEGTGLSCTVWIPRPA